MNFMSDWMLRYDTILPEMLADGVRIMIYAGDQDLICNYYGNRRWVNALQWGQSKDWAAAKDADWMVGDEPAGRVKEVGPLSFVQVFKAGKLLWYLWRQLPHVLFNSGRVARDPGLN